MLAQRCEFYVWVARTISHSNIKFISSRHRVKSSIYLTELYDFWWFFTNEDTLWCLSWGIWKHYRSIQDISVLYCKWKKETNTIYYQGTTKVLSDSPGLVEWLVRLAFSYRSLPDRQAPLFVFSDNKLSFNTQKCVAESSWEKMKLWGQIIVVWQHLAPHFSCSVNNIIHHFFYVHKQAKYIFWKDNISWLTACSARQSV